MWQQLSTGHVQLPFELAFEPIWTCFWTNLNLLLNPFELALEPIWTCFWTPLNLLWNPFELAFKPISTWYNLTEHVQTLHKRKAVVQATNFDLDITNLKKYYRIILWINLCNKYVMTSKLNRHIFGNCQVVKRLTVTIYTSFVTFNGTRI